MYPTIPDTFRISFLFCKQILCSAVKYILTSMQAFATMKMVLCRSALSDLLCASMAITDRNNLINLEGGYL